MKTTYKILGSIYDKIKESEKEYNISNFDNRILNYQERRSIFDYEYCVRKIKLSEFFKIESMDSLEHLINNLEMYDKIIISIDYNVVGDLIFFNFIMKRIRQILTLLEPSIKKMELMNDCP